MDLYRDEILDHYKNPHNFGELTDPKVSFEEYNPLCGDRIRIEVKSDKGKVINVGFTGEGCAVSVAAASLLSDYLKGQRLELIKNLKGEDVLRIVGLETISPGRLKCALLPFEALRGILKQVIRDGK